jgi:hypothetical protein
MANGFFTIIQHDDGSVSFKTECLSLPEAIGLLEWAKVRLRCQLVAQWNEEQEAKNKKKPRRTVKKTK